MMKKVNAMKSSTLSVHSLLPYLLSSFPDRLMFPPVDISSSLVVSTLVDDATSCSNVAALFWVVSDKCLVIDNILSVTLSCCVSRLAREEPVPLPALRYLNSDDSWPEDEGFEEVMVKSSCLSDFSISSMVEMLAFRNACVVLYSCCRWSSTDLVSSKSPSSLARFAKRSMHLRIVEIFSRPASLRVSSSGRVPRKARMSWNGLN